MTGRFSVSLRVLLATGVAGVVALSVAITALTSGSNEATVTAMRTQRSLAVMHGLEQWMRDQLRPLQSVVRNTQAVVADGSLDLSDIPELDGYVRGLMAGTQRLEVVAIVGADNQARRYGRTGPPALEDWSDRPNVATMLAGLGERARAGRTAPEWGEPLWRGGGGHAVFNMRAPLVHDGAFVGTAIVMIGLGPVGEALPRSLSPDVLTPYVLYDRGTVLAHPLLDAGSLGTSGSADTAQPLLKLEDFPDLRLATLWSGTELDLPTPAAMRPGWVRGVQAEGEETIHTVQEIIDYTPAPLMIGVYRDAIEDGAATGPPWLTILVGLVLVGTTAAGALLVGRRIEAPLADVTATARAVAAGDLSLDPPDTPAAVREVDESRSAVRSMLEALRGRERRRGLFGPYVPDDMARRLLSTGHTPSGTQGEATVLNADLSAVLAVVRELGPEDALEVLNGLLTSLVAVVEHHGGVITCLQGNALEAIFNLPDRHPDHATAAVLAALAMQRRLSNIAQDDPRVFCRIGIGTGPVLAGPVGAEGRSMYTVSGDAAVLAAHLASMTTAERVLVSDRSAGLAASIPFVSLGKLPVRGQGADARVFAPADEAPSEDRT